jgi:hypothetical protein
MRPVPSRPIVSKTPEQTPPPGMKGLVLILSPYRASDSRNGTSFERFAQLLEMENRQDHDWAELERASQQSNFDVPLQAIRYHMKNGSLRHVWLICTDDGKNEQGEIVLDARNQPRMPGSWRLAHYVETFVHESAHRQLRGSPRGASADPKNVHFHYHRTDAPKWKCRVPQFGEQSVRDVFQAVNFIFDEEVELAGLAPEEVICDFTGGRSPHTIGMVLACLPARRRIQYTSSRQTSTGAYEGRPRPLEIRMDISWVASQITLRDLVESTREK